MATHLGALAEMLLSNIYVYSLELLVSCHKMSTFIRVTVIWDMIKMDWHFVISKMVLLAETRFIHKVNPYFY